MKENNSTEKKISKLNKIDQNHQNEQKSINYSLKKTKKKPIFNIPIFQINMNYYEIKKRAKKKLKKKNMLIHLTSSL